MDSVLLGNTGIHVSRMCFGTLTLSPLQRNFSVDFGAKLICHAFDKGVNFLDTAELYDNYGAIAQALKYKRDAVVCTKCYAYDFETASKSFEKAIRTLGRDYIDIFMLHEQESEHTFRGHAEALDFFVSMKEKGYIRAVGISTHHVAAARAAVKHAQIDVIHPIYNIEGIGIVDGRRDEMKNAISDCRREGKGVFAMKPLGGGHLIAQREEALKFVLDDTDIHSIAIGMQSFAEIEYNCAFFNGEDVSPFCSDIELQNRALMIHDWCEGCGQCAQACQQGALRISSGKARVDMDKCALCGYCAAKCPQFCIKVV